MTKDITGQGVEPGDILLFQHHGNLWTGRLRNVRSNASVILAMCEEIRPPGRGLSAGHASLLLVKHKEWVKIN